MKTIVLAGGFGSRISEETTNKPKPMVEIGGEPILWHILKHDAYYHSPAELQTLSDVDLFIMNENYKAEIKRLIDPKKFNVINFSPLLPEDAIRHAIV